MLDRNFDAKNLWVENKKFNMKNKLLNNIYVTSPLLPDLGIFNVELREIWESRQLTNMGKKHNLLESRLKNELKVRNLSLFNNGTTALVTAIKALDLPYGSEVITTPFTFAATPHCISWNGAKPVFCDIEPNTMTIDPEQIEKHITPNTSAILAVNVYGFHCDVDKIEEIAKKHNIKVIYDAAHAFSTEINGVAVGSFGDITMFSFHATKLYNTIEGGCLTYNDDELVNKIYNLRNFGIRNEEIVEDIGINGKMNELQAAIGLLNLDLYQEEKKKREYISSLYNQCLSGIEGIKIPQMPDNTTRSYQYFPIIIEKNYKISRDELYLKLKENNIITRKYFYPLCTQYDCYRDLPSSSPENIPVADDLKDRVLCLPFYGDLNEEIVELICEVMS